MSDNQYPPGMAEAIAKFAQQELGTTATQISNNLMTVGAQSPDQAAVVQRQASILGVPADTVRQDPDLARQQLLTRSVDPYNLQQVAPHLARFLTSPSNTAISHDDIPNLAGVEGSVQRLPAPTNPAPQLDPGAPPPTMLGAFGQGLGSSFNRAAAAFNWVLGSAPEAYDKLASWVSGSPTTAASDWWTRNMVQPLDAQQQKELTLSPNAGFAEKATYQAGNLLGTLAQIVGTGGMGAPEAVAGAAMPSMAQAVGQAVTHGAQAMAFPSLTSAVNTGRDVYAKTGDIGAALRAAQMQYGVTTAGGIVPLAAPGGVLTRLATGAVSGAATVAGGNALMNTALPPSMRQPTTLDDLILGSLTNAIMGGALGPRAAQPYDMAVRDTVTNSMKAQQAEGGYEALSQLSEAATASKTRGRDQQAFGQLVQNMTEGGNLQDLYVSARDLDGALQQAGISGTQLAEKLPDVASQLNEAIQTNGDVRIPVADYATHIAGGPADAALLPHLKTDPDGMTYQQSQDYMAGQQQAMTDQAAKIVSDKQAQDAQQTQSQAVYDQVLTQLNDTGRFSPDVNHGYAALARDFYTTTAARLGITPDELYQRYPLNVQGDALAQAGATMEQPAWHGSPYRGIENDGFQLNKIGTGEGAQAYGHGIYFAGDRGVAENYRNTLRADGFQIGDTGEVFNPDTLQHLNVRTLAREGDLEGAISKAREIAASDSPVASLAKEDLGVLESIKARGGLKENIGQLYRAEIPEDHQLLDWDKPLTEQPQGVQDGLRRLLTSDAVEQRALDDFDVSTRKELADKILDPKSTGAELYGSLSDVFRDERGASAALRDAGIPGLRYLDGVSRDKAEGTHNYVIWDEKHLGNDIKTYYQDGEAPRGAFQPSTNTIGLLKDADLSTFLHESGHFFLSTMRDIVARDDAPADMRRDMDALGKWYGGNADDIAREAAGYGASDTTADHVRAYLDAKTSGDVARDQAIDRALHEQFARGFEKYLFEGKAPSTELQPLSLLQDR